MQNKIELTLCQKNPIVGNIEHNFNVICQEYKNAKSDLVVFPECFLTGYSLEDLIWNKNFMNKVHEKISELQDIVNDKALIFGAPYIIDNNVYNCLFFMDNKSMKIVKKIELPNFGVFDEKRTFTQGTLKNNNNVIHYKNFKIGLGICEDFWHDTLPNYLIKQKVDFVISINGSPYEIVKNTKHLVRKKLGMKFIENNIGFVYLNMVGGQDENVFDGDSFVMNIINHDDYTEYTGLKLALSCCSPIDDLHFKNMELYKGFYNCFNFDTFVEQTETIEFSKTTKLFHKNTLDINKTKPKYDDNEDLHEYVKKETYNALILGLRDYFRKSNAFQGIVIGLSGGVDSALDLLLAVDAIGADKVLAVRLPSKYSSQHSLDDAEALCKNLNVKMETISIQDAVDNLNNENLKNLFASFGKTKTDVTEENIQARIRNNILMAISNKLNYMLVVNGNMSENATGYFSLGDSVGGYNPIKNLYKSEVFELCHWRNKNTSVIGLNKTLNNIPENILTKEPSAELAEGQKDSDSLPDYVTLDKLIAGIIEDHARDHELLQFAPYEVIQKVKKLIFNAEFKRRIVNTPGVHLRYDFSKGRRYPIINHWR